MLNQFLIECCHNDTFTEKQVQSLCDALYEICDNTHAHCNEVCPVYEINGAPVNPDNKTFDENSGCDCFKHGHRMYSFIKNNS